MDLRRRADAGNPSAQFLVALGHGEGRLGFVVNFDESSRYLGMARQSTGGHGVIGGVVEGYYLELSGRDLENEASPNYASAASSGYVPGEYILEVSAYKILKRQQEEGQTIEKKAQFEVIETMQKAAQLGFSPAMEFLGQRYLDGWGVEANVTTAFKYFHDAADKGDAPAQIFLAKAYEAGVPEWGISANKILSQKFYKAAANQGVPSALNKLTKKGGCIIV